MGSAVCCSSSNQNSNVDIFSYIYYEDNKEIKIVHNDTIETSHESIKPSLVDCETKLKRSQKRFKDFAIES
jgi:hypothetical protein